MAQTNGSIDIRDGGSDVELLQLCDNNGAGVVNPFLRKITIAADGSSTVVDTLLDGVTPYVVVGTVGKCDKEYVQDSQQRCAIVASPVDYPNVGDPAGTAYNIGDKVIFQFVTDVDNIFNHKLVAIKNLSNNTYPVPFYLEVNGVVVFGTTQPNPADFGDCTPDTCGKVEARCKCDDVNGDGSVITNFVKAYEICVTNGVITSTFIGNFTDDTFTTPYVLQGTEVDCSAIGADARVSQQRLVLNGAGSFSIPADCISYSVKVFAAGGGPTFTDSAANVSPLYAGETMIFSDGSDDGIVFVPGATITTLVGDLVVIDYQKLTV